MKREPCQILFQEFQNLRRSTCARRSSPRQHSQRLDCRGVLLQRFTARCHRPDSILLVHWPPSVFSTAPPNAHCATAQSSHFRCMARRGGGCPLSAADDRRQAVHHFPSRSTASSVPGRRRRTGVHQTPSAGRGRTSTVQEVQSALRRAFQNHQDTHTQCNHARFTCNHSGTPNHQHQIPQALSPTFSLTQ